MKKFIAVILMVCLFAMPVLAQTITWTYLINEIRTPSLNEIVINITLKQDGTNYVTIDIAVDAEHLATLATRNERLTYIRGVVEARIAEYINIYNTVAKIKTYEGTEITIQ